MYDYMHVGGCIQKFPDWPPGGEICKWYSSLPLDVIVSLFSESL